MAKGYAKRTNYLHSFSAVNHAGFLTRMNEVFLVCEKLSSNHYNQLANLLPKDREFLLQLAKDEASHIEKLTGCLQGIGVNPDLSYAQHLLVPIHDKFTETDRNSDLLSCFVIQTLVIKNFLVCAYLIYLKVVVDDHEKHVIEKILVDEFNHIDQGMNWLRINTSIASADVAKCINKSVPIVLSIVHIMRFDMKSIGINPNELKTEFANYLLESLVEINFSRPKARKLVRSLWASQAMASWEGWPYLRRTASTF